MRSLILALALLPPLAACGTTSTKTVTRTGSATGTTTIATTATAATTTTAAGGPVYFAGAVGGASQRPASLELTGDGTLAVEHVQWASWGGGAASGTGNAVYHGCTPNCAAAPVNTALVSVRLSRVRTCSGRRYYSAVTLTLNSGQRLEKDFLQRSWSPC